MEKRFSGSEPNLGHFDCRVAPDGEDWCIYVTYNDGNRVERWCSTWGNEACYGLTKVYSILRELGFTLSGYQSAQVLQINN